MKNKTLRLSLIVLLLAIVTMCVITGTLARYVETVSGTDSARVAKFAYKAKVGATEFTASPVTINLFNTINDGEVYGAEANINTEKLVAPGTCGSFDIVAENTSETKVAVTYSMAETNNNDVPIVYVIKNGATSKYYSAVETGTITLGSDIKEKLEISTDTITIDGDLDDMLADVSLQLNATDGTDANKTTATTTVAWFWAFGNGTTDTRDTGLGKLATLPTVNVVINARFAQVD